MPILQVPFERKETRKTLLLVDIIHLGFQKFRYKPCVWIGLLFYDKSGEAWIRTYSFRITNKENVGAVLRYFYGDEDITKATDINLIASIRNHLSAGNRPTLSVQFKDWDIVSIEDCSSSIEYSPEMIWPLELIHKNQLLNSLWKSQSHLFKTSKPKLLSFPKEGTNG